jgi:hypothetical protein
MGVVLREFEFEEEEEEEEEEEVVVDGGGDGRKKARRSANSLTLPMEGGLPVTVKMRSRA